MPYWPGLSHHFGLNPTHVGQLSVGEWNQYIAALEQIARDAQELRRKAR